QIIQMHELGTYDLWINDPGLEFFDDVCSSQPTNPQLRLAEALRDSFLRLSAHISRTVFRRYEIVLAELVHALTRSAPSVPYFSAHDDINGNALGDEWKQHTAEGFAAVQGRLDPSAAVVIQHHHQHFDGSGFGARAYGQIAPEKEIRPSAKPQGNKYAGTRG